MREKGSYFMAGLLSGMVLGAVTALLLAPHLRGKAEQAALTMQKAQRIWVQGVRKIRNSLPLLAHGDVEKLCQEFSFGSKWLVIG